MIETILIRTADLLSRLQPVRELPELTSEQRIRAIQKLMCASGHARYVLDTCDPSYKHLYDFARKIFYLVGGVFRELVGPSWYRCDKCKKEYVPISNMDADSIAILRGLSDSKSFSDEMADRVICCCTCNDKEAEPMAVCLECSASYEILGAILPVSYTVHNSPRRPQTRGVSRLADTYVFDEDETEDDEIDEDGNYVDDDGPEVF